jgi:hypothetical protein
VSTGGGGGGGKNSSRWRCSGTQVFPFVVGAAGSCTCSRWEDDNAALGS